VTTTALLPGQLKGMKVLTAWQMEWKAQGNPIVWVVLLLLLLHC